MKIILKAIFTQALVLISLPAFAQQSNKAETQIGLCPTKTDSANFKIFKKEAEKQIAANRQKIAALKTKKLSADAKANKKFTKKIIALEGKNNELQRRINECTNVKPNLWLSFKSKLTDDMKKLGDALDNMAIDQYELNQ